MTKVKPYIPFICFFLIFYAFLWRVELLYGTDDTAHFDMLEKLGGVGWIQWRAETWQPRLFSDFFYAAFLYKLGLWKIVNAAVAALLPLGLWRATTGYDFLTDTDDRERNRALIFSASLICILFFFIYPNTVTSSAVWYTGSFNYLWPVTALIFGLTPFFRLLQGIKPYPGKIWIAIGIFASLYASFTEQTAIVSVGISLLILLFCFYRKRAVPKAILAHFAILLGSALWYIYAVLTSPRMSAQAEVDLFPEFASFGIRDKLQLGIHVYDTHLIRSTSLLFLTLALIAGILAFRRFKGKSSIFRTLFFLPAFYAMLNIVPFRYLLSGTWLYPSAYADSIGMPSAFDHNPAEWFDYLQDVPPLGWGLEPRNLFVAWLAFAVVLFMLIPLFFAFKRKTSRILACLLYLAAYASGAVMGFSPTVFASGSRPYFLSNILLLLLCAMLIREGMNADDRQISENFLVKTKQSRVAMAVIAFVAAYILLLYLFVYSSTNYWWF